MPFLLRTGESKYKFLETMTPCGTGTKPRSLPTRRGVPCDRSPHQGGDGRSRSPRHAQAASRHRRSAADAPGIFHRFYFLVFVDGITKFCISD